MFRVLITLLLISVFSIVYAQTEVLTIEKTKSFIDILKSVAENSPEGKDYAILKLDSLIGSESNKENVMLMKEAKDQINSIKSPFHKSRSVDILNKEDLKGFQIKRDKFTNSTFITPVYGLWGGQFRTYIVNIDGQVLLRFVVEYRSSDWIFFNKIIMLTGDEKIEYYDYNPIRSVYDNVEEQSDVVVSDKLFKFLEKIVMNQEADVRLQGDERVYDTKISKKQIKSIENALRIYKKLIDE